MAMSTKKKTEFKEMYHNYLEKYWEFTKSKYTNILPWEYSKVGGIISTKIAFYLHMNYGMNYFMAKNYICPDKSSYKAMEQFIDDNVKPETISTFHYENIDIFKELCSKKLNKDPQSILIFDKVRKKFVCMKNGLFYTESKKHNATSFGCMFDLELSKEFLYEKVCKRYDTMSIDNYLFMRSQSNLYKYHIVASTRKD